MAHCCYKLEIASDFSLNKYSALSESGPKGVLEQHRFFWRQINQWGKMFGGSIHFIYQYDNQQMIGKRINLVIWFDAQTNEAIDCIKRIMRASILSPYYEQLELCDDSCLQTYTYPWLVNLVKKEQFITASSNDNLKFYTVSDWEMNEDARLYSMLKSMETLDAPCAYCVSLYPTDISNQISRDLEFILPRLREMNSFSVKTVGSTISSGGKDDNAKRALKYYEDLMETVSEEPHCLVNIVALANTEAQAMQILDAAASEALFKGCHELYGENFNRGITEIVKSKFSDCSDEDAPRQLKYFPHLFTLEQMVPFAVLPVLFSGETIELRKETVPDLQDGLLLGENETGELIKYPINNLSKHAFLAGMPGSGKTNAMMSLISEIHSYQIPVLILEPAKREYRSLLMNEDMKDISFFSPSANSLFPIHINPFQFPLGMKLSDHINRLLDVFMGTFQLDPPFPMLLTEGIQDCYEELKWLPGMTNCGKLQYPTLKMLYAKIEVLLDKYHYAEEIRSNLQSVLQVRIGSLMAREMGDIFDVQESTYKPEEWLQNSAIIELASLGTSPSNFMMLMIMTLIREALDVIPYTVNDMGAPRHIIFMEEAHNLIANRTEQESGSIDPKISATAYITKMLAEVRALGEGIVIADQLPTAMAPEVIKNTSLKIGLRLTAQDEREILGSTMSADDSQKEKMGVFTPGEALISYEGLQKPFVLHVPKYKGDSITVDKELFHEISMRKNCIKTMNASNRIVEQKYRKYLHQIIQERKLVLRKLEDGQNYPSITQAGVLDLQQKSNAVMKSICKITAEIVVYLMNQVVRRKELKDCKDETSAVWIYANDNVDNSLLDLYSELKKERDMTFEEFSKYPKLVKMEHLQEIMDILTEQQMIVKQSVE